MFADAIRDFTRNLDALRDFVDVVDAFLSKSNEKDNENSSALMKLINVAMSRVDPENFKPDQETVAAVEQEYKDYYSVTVNEENGKKTANISVRGHVGATFVQGLSALGRSEKRKEILSRSAIMNVTSTAEWFLSQILHSYFEKFEDAVGSKENVFSLDDLRALGSIEDAKKRLIEQRVEEIMRGNLDDWLKFLRERVKLSMGYLDSEKDELGEVFQRRNLVVHNGSVINSIYMRKVPEHLRKGLNVGQEIHLPKTYLERSISLFEKHFILMAVELWKKIDPADGSRATALINSAYQHLLAGRWAIAEGLSYFLMQDAKLSEKDRLYGQLNYWQAVKWQNRYEDIKSDVEKVDFSAKEPLYQLCLHAIADRKEEFFELLPVVLKTKSLSPSDLKTWPLFREMRRLSECEQYLPAASKKTESDDESNGQSKVATPPRPQRRSAARKDVNKNSASPAKGRRIDTHPHRPKRKK